MHAIVNRSALVEVLGVGTSIASQRTPKEVLRCVRLSCDNGALLACMTDLEVGLRGRIRQVEIRRTGEALVSAEKLSLIARASTDETLTLEVVEGNCHIRGRDSHYEIYTSDVEEFPPVADLEGEPDMLVDAQALLGALNRTRFCVAKEPSRYAINGVLWERAGRKLHLVATDGRRLVWTTCLPSSTQPAEKKVIVPLKAVSVFQGILSGAEGDAALQFHDNRLVMRCGDYVVSTTLVEGNFPNYQDVVPRDNDRKAELNAEDFLSAVRRASLLTDEKSKGISLRFSEGKVVLSSRAPEQGEATITMAADYTGAPLEIGFSAAFLEDALRVVGTPTVTMEMKDADRAAMMRAGTDFIYVLMPVSPR